MASKELRGPIVFLTLIVEGSHNYVARALFESYNLC